MTKTPPGRLYVVATPIGNLGDMSARAIEVLRRCAVIAAEDTRHTGILLKHHGIETRQVSMHEHNESGRAAELVARLSDGEDIALVSDAGTPAISDPGFELVRAAAAAGIEIVAVPGPCAAIAALCIGALPTDRFCFEGFLPAKAGPRRTRLRVLAEETRTIVLYESPHRLHDTLADCAAILGMQRRAVIAREISKVHERTYRGSLRELLDAAAGDPNLSRGEIVLLVHGAEPAGEDAADGAGGAALDRTLTVLLEELPLKQAASLAARITGVRGNEAYRRALELKKRS